MMELPSLLLFSTLAAIFSICWSTLPGMHLYAIVMILHGAVLTFRIPIDPGLLVATTASILAAGALTGCVPSLLLSPSDDSAALMLRPGEEALQKGYAPTAVLAAAAGGAAALLIILFPGIWLVGHAGPFVGLLLRNHLHWVAWCIILHLLISEGDGLALLQENAISRAFACWRPFFIATFCLLASGLLGLAVFTRHTAGTLYIGRYLLPVCAGLFSIPASIISALADRPIPRQHYRPQHIAPLELTTAILTGVTAGGIATFLPSFSGGTSLIFLKRLPHGHLTTPVTHGAVRMTYYLGAFLLLWIPTLNLACGVPALHLEAGLRGHRELLYAAGGGAAVGASISLLVLPHLLHGILLGIHRYGLRILHVASFGILLLAVSALTGPRGLLLMIIATAIGLIPLLAGCSRLPLLGFLLLPLALRAAVITQ